jgi:hypothetical protein
MRILISVNHTIISACMILLSEDEKESGGMQGENQRDRGFKSHPQRLCQTRRTYVEPSVQSHLPAPNLLVPLSAFMGAFRRVPCIQSS